MNRWQKTNARVREISRQRRKAKLERSAVSCPNCARPHETAAAANHCETRAERSALDVRNWMYRGLTP